MITSEFLDRLDTIRHEFQWKLDDNSMLVPERRQQPRFRIRATRPGLSDAIIFDPIGAVCYIETGFVHEPEAWMDAADAIELSLIDAGDLTAAINDRTWEDKNGHRGPNPYHHQLREYLLTLTGLSVPVPAFF